MGKENVQVRSVGPIPRIDTSDRCFGSKLPIHHSPFTIHLSIEHSFCLFPPSSFNCSLLYCSKTPWQTYICGMKYTQTTLDKLEKLIAEAGYIVRYERGSFQSGFCILEDRKVVVLNKFLQLEGRINTLIDLVPQLKIAADALPPESRKIFEEIMGKHSPRTPEAGT
jgi:hypothetical protein